MAAGGAGGAGWEGPPAEGRWVGGAGGARAGVCEHGAHVCAWEPADGAGGRLFLSARAAYAPPRAIRGGVPLCWPQFSDLGPLASQHGFARNSRWEAVEPAPPGPGAASFVLREGPPEWGRPFQARLDVRVGGQDLDIAFQVANPGPEAMEFTFALHTYFAVDDVAGARVEGLQGCRYLDSLRERAECTEAEEAVTFRGEVDRIYLDTPSRGELRVVDGAGGRAVRILKRNLPDAVVWNPWEEKSRRMGDFGDDEYHRMVCVEAGAIQPPVRLEAGATWQAGQTLRAESLS